MRKKLSPAYILTFLLLVIWLILQIYPLLFMILSSFKTESEIALNPMGLPESVRLDAYEEAWKGRTEAVAFSRYFANSMVVTVCAIALLCFSALLAGYALARLYFVGRKLLYLFIVCLISVPVQALIIPLYNVYESWHLTNNHLAMIPLYAAFSLPYSIFIMRTNIEAIPREIEEAALIDGCGLFQNFIHIIAPMSRGSIATIAIVNLTGIWSELMYASIFLVLPKSRTLSVVVTLFQPNQYSISMSTLMAALTMVSLPLLLAYFIFQKQIVKGMSAGAVK